MFLKCQHRTLRLWVLAWFFATLLVGIGNPLIRKAHAEPVCSSGGVIKWVEPPPAPATTGHGHALDCALCLPTYAPPVHVATSTLPARSALRLQVPPTQTHAPPRALDRPPARAPPVFS